MAARSERRPAGAEAQELQRRARVLGNELDQARRQRRLHQLARPETVLEPHVEPAGLERLTVDLGEQLALREVEGRDGDRLIVERAPLLSGVLAASCSPRP